MFLYLSHTDLASGVFLYLFIVSVPGLGGGVGSRRHHGLPVCSRPLLPPPAAGDSGQGPPHGDRGHPSLVHGGRGEKEEEQRLTSGSSIKPLHGDRGHPSLVHTGGGTEEEQRLTTGSSIKPQSCGQRVVVERWNCHPSPQHTEQLCLYHTVFPRDRKRSGKWSDNADGLKFLTIIVMKCL